MIIDDGDMTVDSIEEQNIAIYTAKIPLLTSMNTFGHQLCSSQHMNVLT